MEKLCKNCKYYAEFKNKNYGDCYGPRDKSDTSECSSMFGCVDWKEKEEK